MCVCVAICLFIYCYEFKIDLANYSGSLSWADLAAVCISADSTESEGQTLDRRKGYFGQILLNSNSQA